MKRKRIPLAEPVLGGNEKKYVIDCLDKGWISGSGHYVTSFEEAFADSHGAAHAIAVANGTVALHISLLALGVGRGDEVIVPDLTYIAAANAVTYCGACPIFADVNPITRTLDVTDAERKISAATKAIVPVHLYGHPADMEAVQQLARAHRLHTVEDAAEAHGAECRGQRVGSFGDLGTFSFYGNKIITTGEGGMVTTNNSELADRVRLLKGQGMATDRRYWFAVVGYNYRMTNLQAAVGLAQLERLDWFVDRRREVAGWYNETLKGMPVELPTEAEWAKNVYWLYSICVARDVNRDRVMADLDEEGIETRPFFYPLHQMPPYFDPNGDATFPIATDLAGRGISLPSSASLSSDEVVRIGRALRGSLEKQDGGK